MSVRPRFQRLPVLTVAVGALVFAASSAQLAAQSHKVSVESLIYDLKSPDPLRRLVAARELGAMKYRAATPDLVAMAQDPVDSVRRQVEASLELMQDIQALPGFIAFATDAQTDIRAHAVAALVNLHLPRDTGMTAALSKLGEMMMLTPDRDLTVVVEPDVPVDPGVVETLRARLTDSDRGIRRTAIRGLGILRARAGIPDLIQIVREDRDDGLRFDGVRALRKIDDRSIGDQLVAMLNINNDAVRNELMTTLGAMRYRGAVPELTRIVDQAAKATDLARVVALAALADIGDPSSAAVFQRLKNDRSEALRLYANEGIARTAEPAQKTEISAARLTEKSAFVRTAQAFALLQIGEREYLDELVRALDKSSLRELAKEYLIETGPGDREALFAPRAVSSTTRAELAEVWGRLGDPNALPRLQELSHDNDGNVVRAAELATRRLTVTSSSPER